MRLMLALIITAQVWWAGPAAANEDTSWLLAEYAKANDVTRPLIDSHVFGIEQGLLVASVYLQSVRKEKPLYCPPKPRSLTGRQITDKMIQLVKDRPKLGALPPPTVVFEVLTTTFPCPG